MLGFRGCRLGIGHPDLYRMQVAAIADAVADRVAAGGNPHAEIMIPLVANDSELAFLRRDAEAAWHEVMAAAGLDLAPTIGTMIEVPRAALLADTIAVDAEFFSFGTNDLTQMTWAFSRDDAEAHFLGDYLEQGILPFNPFETIDVAGVGQLVEMAVEKGRQARPDISLGICGEHGGDSASIRFFEQVGLDYVSCSPFRVPAARLAAAQAAMQEGENARDED